MDRASAFNEATIYATIVNVNCMAELILSEAKDLCLGLVKGAFIEKWIYEVDAVNSVNILNKDDTELSVK